MVGEGERCPECGADLAIGNINCPLCCPDVEARRLAYHRYRKRTTTIVIIILCAATILFVSWTVVTVPTPSASEKLLITATEMGPGWTGTKPEIDPIGGDGQHPALVRLAYENGSSYYDVSIRLNLYRNTNMANASYLQEYEGMMSYPGMSNSTVNDLTVGDRAVIVTYSQEGVVWHKLLMMQKGNVIAFFVSPDSGVIAHTLDNETLVELAEAQADKLP